MWLNLIYLIYFRNLAQNNFPELPTLGLQTVRTLSIKHNSKLLKFPSPRHLPSVKVLRLYYPYHCCAFLNEKNEMHNNYHPNTTQVSTSIVLGIHARRTPRLANQSSIYSEHEVLRCCFMATISSFFVIFNEISKIMRKLSV
jgi:hypothetical protein